MEEIGRKRKKRVAGKKELNQIHGIGRNEEEERGSVAEM